MSQEDLVYRLLKRAEIRRSIPSRKSVQEGKPDRIADLLEEAAKRIQELEDINKERIMITVMQQWEEFILQRQDEFLSRFCPEGTRAQECELTGIWFGSNRGSFSYFHYQGQHFTYDFVMNDFLRWYHTESVTKLLNALDRRCKDAC